MTDVLTHAHLKLVKLLFRRAAEEGRVTGSNLNDEAKLREMRMQVYLPLLLMLIRHVLTLIQPSAYLSTTIGV